MRNFSRNYIIVFFIFIGIRAISDSSTIQSTGSKYARKDLLRCEGVGLNKITFLETAGSIFVEGKGVASSEPCTPVFSTARVHERLICPLATKNTSRTLTLSIVTTSDSACTKGMIEAVITGKEESGKEAAPQKFTCREVR